MPSRRQVLAGLGGATAVSLSGCLTDTDPPAQTDENATAWWPMPTFDQWGSCYNPNPVGPREGVRERWSLDIPEPSSRPVVADGTAYLPTAESVLAVDAQTGETVWEATFGERVPWPQQVLVAGDTVYVGIDGRTAVYALDAESGAEQWTFSPDGYGCAALHMDDDRRNLFAGDSYGNVYALDPATGDPRWNRELFGTVTAFAHGIPEVLVGTQAGEVYALSPGEGRGLWRRKLPGMVESLATGNGDGVYVSLFGKPVYELDAEGVGETLWTADAGFGTDSFVVAPGTVYASAGDLTALDQRTGERRWRVDTDYRCGPAAAGGTIYVGGAGEVAGYALDGGVGLGSLRFGAKRWSYAVDGSPKHGLAVADGAVFVLTGGGQTDDATAYALEAV